MKFGTICLLMLVFVSMQSAFAGKRNRKLKAAIKRLRKRNRSLRVINAGISNQLNTLKANFVSLNNTCFTGCKYNNGSYADEATFEDDCNACVCNNGVVACTKKSCNQGCKYSGITYSNGDTFISGDDCYNCTCQNGCVDCTKKICEEVPVYRSVTQSSEHSSIRPASRAVDNDFATISVTAQNPKELNPWWMLEFKCNQAISGVLVWNRKDCCHTLLRNMTITLDGQYCGHIGEAPPLGMFVKVTCPVTLIGRKLKIQKDDQLVLNIAEVQPSYDLAKGPSGC